MLYLPLSWHHSRHVVISFFLLFHFHVKPTCRFPGAVVVIFAMAKKPQQLIPQISNRSGRQRKRKTIRTLPIVWIRLCTRWRSNVTNVRNVPSRTLDRAILIDIDWCIRKVWMKNTVVCGSHRAPLPMHGMRRNVYPFGYVTRSSTTYGPWSGTDGVHWKEESCAEEAKIQRYRCRCCW
jgi:hypothetical protein